MAWWRRKHESVEKPMGEDKVSGLRVSDTNTGEEREIACEGLFLAIGHIPNTSVFKGKLDMDDAGYLITKPGTSYTSLEGVFAAGDCVDSVYRQAITAAAMGCKAAIDAERWLGEQGVE